MRPLDGILVGRGLIQEPINWLQDSTNAVLIAIVATAWRSVPLLTLLMLAALRTIPSSQKLPRTNSGNCAMICCV